MPLLDTTYWACEGFNVIWWLQLAREAFFWLIQSLSCALLWAGSGTCKSNCVDIQSKLVDLAQKKYLQMVKTDKYSGFPF